MYLIFLFVCCISSLVQSAKHLEDELHFDFNSNAEIVEQLVLHMQKTDARVKLLEEHNGRLTEQLNTMQGKLVEYEKENLKLRQMISASESLNEMANDKTEKEVGRVQRGRKYPDFEITRRADVDDHVAFTALLSAHAEHLGQNQNIAFDKVIVNDGNAYNPHAGLFIAPFTGTYVFSTTVRIEGRDVTDVGFAKNGNVFTDIYVNGSESFFDSSAQTIVLNLQSGDDVSIKHTGSDKTIAGPSYSSFSGFLLYRSTSDGSIIG